MHNQHENRNTNETGPFSWWSWRPGIRPRNALLLGVSLMLIGLFLTLLGLVTLLVGIEDALLPPLRVPGIVRQQSASTVISSSQLTLALKGPEGIPSTATLTVSKSAFEQIKINSAVIVLYSQNLHFAYEIDYAGKRFTLPGSSAAGNPFGSAALLLFGLLLLPYPLLLTHWGWQDLLIERYKRDRRVDMQAFVVDKRATAKTRTARPGFTGRGSRPWYGLALLPLEPGAKQRISTFSVDEETYRRVQNDTHIKIVFSPHLHYVYSVQ